MEENRPYTICYGGRDTWKALAFAPTLEDAQAMADQGSDALVEIEYDDWDATDHRALAVVTRVVARRVNGVWEEL